jgi:hypothetical protein
MGDTDEEAHDGDAFGWGAIEISDFISTCKCGSERDERRCVAGRGEPTDRNPRIIDKVEVVHEFLKVEVLLEAVVAGGFGG